MSVPAINFERRGHGAPPLPADDMPAVAEAEDIPTDLRAVANRLAVAAT